MLRDTQNVCRRSTDVRHFFFLFLFFRVENVTSLRSDKQCANRGPNDIKTTLYDICDSMELIANADLMANQQN